MTREQMIAAVRAVDDAEFQGEVRFNMDLDREYAYDEMSALFDVEDRAELAVAEETLPASRKAARHLLKVARQTLIAIGFYRAMPADEIASTSTSSGRSPWNFMLGGVPYISDDAAEEWQFPESEKEDA